MVQKYLAHPKITRKNACSTYFAAAVRVFVHREYTLPNPAIAKQPPSQVSQACNGVQGAAATSCIQESGGIDAVLGRLRVLRLQLSESKKRYLAFRS